MAALIQILDQTASRLEHTPREHASFLALASIALYFGQWSKSMQAVARRFFGIALAWAQDVKRQCDSCLITSPGYGELRGKYCLMTGYALFCISKLNWNDEDLGTYVSLLLQFYNGLVYTSGISQDLQAQIQEIKSLCCTEAAQRLNYAKRRLDSDSTSLTR